LSAEIFHKLTELLQDVFDDGSIVATPELTAKDVEAWDSVSNVSLAITRGRVRKPRGFKARRQQVV